MRSRFGHRTDNGVNVIYNRADVIAALHDLYTYWSKQEENQNIIAAKQAIQEILIINNYKEIYHENDN